VADPEPDAFNAVKAFLGDITRSAEKMEQFE
jgi:hypothetical protein